MTHLRWSVGDSVPLVRVFHELIQNLGGRRGERDKEIDSYIYISHGDDDQWLNKLREREIERKGATGRTIFMQRDRGRGEWRIQVILCRWIWREFLLAER